MVRKLKLIIPLLILSQFGFADTASKFWLGVGYDYGTQYFQVDSQVYGELATKLPVHHGYIALNEHYPFITIEAEHHLSPCFSTSVKTMLANTDKSFIPGVLLHRNHAFLEVFGKYHLNQFSYLLGYSMKQGYLKLQAFDNNSSCQEHQYISPGIALGGEMVLSENSKTELIAVLTPPLGSNTTQLFEPSLQISTRLSFSYSLNND